jgi:hypothetical protein
MRAQKAKEQNHFSHEKSFVLVKNTFSGQIFANIRQKIIHGCLVLDKDPMWGAFPK